MILALIDRFSRWLRIMGLRADIAGYEDDLNTLVALNQQGSMAHHLILERLEQARYELYLVLRQKPVQKNRRKA